MTLRIHLNDDLDAHLYKGVFRHHGRVHIPDVLTFESAKTIYEHLQDRVPWQAHFNDGAKTYDLHRDQLAVLPDNRKALLVDQLHHNARLDFQYLFLNYSITDAVEQQSNPGVELNAFHDFINSDEVLDLVREITDVREIEFADCQATLYKPGHFLTEHNDNIERSGRLVAYTFSFTPEWRTDYGGVLHFLDEDGHVDEGYLPKFNALNLFRIPARHAVSYVAPFAPRGRYSIIGWFKRQASAHPA